MQRRDLLKTAPALLLPVCPGLAWAQDYPKAGALLRYVVPFPPGGLTDVMARLVGQQLGERWKVTVTIDNKPGSGGQIGAAEVAKAAGDGQTLLAITMTHAANVTLFKGRTAFDFQKDLRPVALLAGSPMLVVVPKSEAEKSREKERLRQQFREGKLDDRPVEMEVRELLTFYKFPGDAIPIVRGSATAAVNGKEQEDAGARA